MIVLSAVFVHAGGEVGSLLTILKSEHNFSDDRLTRFVVVGNGPLTSRERHEINGNASTAIILRFNDENSFESHDQIHVHVMRHPSWSSRKNGLVEWHIAPFIDWVPRNSKVTSIVYEQQFEDDNEADSGELLFPSTCTDHRCWINRTKYGASTGGIVLSKLNEHPTVKNISVYAMNWNGSPDHVDFLFPELVYNFCSKCNIHTTHSDAYGQSGTITALVLLGTIAIMGVVVFGWIFDMEAMAMYRYVFVSEVSGASKPSMKKGEKDGEGAKGVEDPKEGGGTNPPPQQPPQETLPLIPG
jgi:hypothetical protein